MRRVLSVAGVVFLAALALLPGAQAATILPSPTNHCEGPSLTDCGTPGPGCQYAVVSLLPPGADVNENCLPPSSTDSPEDATAYADETADETAEDAPT